MGRLLRGEDTLGVCDPQAHLWTLCGPPYARCAAQSQRRGKLDSKRQHKWKDISSVHILIKVLICQPFGWQNFYKLVDNKKKKLTKPSDLKVLSKS